MADKKWALCDSCSRGLVRKRTASRITLALLSLGILSVVYVPLSISDQTAILAVDPPEIWDPVLVQGFTFSINVTIANVTDMWGYELFLSYNTSVLTATAYSPFFPFGMQWPSKINDTAGYVYLSFSMSLGVEPGDGFSTVDPSPIIRIDFVVDAVGMSELNLHDTMISDPGGGSISHVAVDGWFKNTPLTSQPPVASFTWMPATPATDETVTFNASASYDNDGIIVSWDWDFDDETPHGSGETTTHVYMTEGTYNVTLTVTDNDDLTSVATGLVTVTTPVHNIAVTNVTSHKTVAGQGYNLTIYVSVENLGDSAETFNVTLSINQTKLVSDLLPGNQTTLCFEWNTTDVTYGNYTLSASAQLPDDTDPIDNTLVNGSVLVTIPGDVNGDQTVSILDAGSINGHWYPGPPVGPLGYGANADINNDGSVNILDAGIVSANWKKSW